MFLAGTDIWGGSIGSRPDYEGIDRGGEVGSCVRCGKYEEGEGVGHSKKGVRNRLKMEKKGWRKSLRRKMERKERREEIMRGMREKRVKRGEQAKPQGNFWAALGEKYRGRGLTA